MQVMDYPSESVDDINECDNLHKVLKMFQEFHLVFERLTDENEQLRKDVNQSDSQISLSRDNEKALMQELSILKSTLSSLQRTVASLSHIEDENKSVCNKMKELEQNQMTTHTKNERYVQSLHVKLGDLTQKYSNELANLKAQYEAKAKKEIEIYRKMINDKEIEIQQLRDDIVTLQKEHNERVLRIKIKHERKLLRVQEEGAKFVQFASKPSTAGLVTTSLGVDILRQKIKSMERQHSSEVFELNKTISSLKEKLQVSNDRATKMQENPERSVTKRKRFLYSETTEF